MEKVFIIFGGASAEHDISIITAMQLSKNLQNVYDVEKIYLDINNNFYLASNIDDVSFFKEKSNLKLKPIIISNGVVYKKGVFLKKYLKIDKVINCCHGGVGENGVLSSFFEINKIEYTNCSPQASCITMDKSLTKALLKDSVNIIKGIKITKLNYKQAIKTVQTDFSNDLIVKPNALGSSIGVAIATKKSFKKQVDAIFLLNDDALVEERIVNMIELNQACYKSADGLKLSLIEQPISNQQFLTFREKYQNKTKGTDRVIPAKISKELEDEIFATTKKIYTELDLNGVVRIDYIYDLDKNILYLNEVNTIPGSMSYYLYEPLGVDYISLVEDLLKNTKPTQQYTYFASDVLDKKI